MRACLLSPPHPAFDVLVPGATPVDVDDAPDVVLLGADPAAIPVAVLTDVTAAVERGAVLVCLGVPEGDGWAAITGVRPGEVVPGGEVFAAPWRVGDDVSRVLTWAALVAITKFPAQAQAPALDDPSQLSMRESIAALATGDVPALRVGSAQYR